MHELGDVPDRQPEYQEDVLRTHAAQLSEQPDVILGAEDVTEPETDETSAHNPAADVDTADITNGYDFSDTHTDEAAALGASVLADEIEFTEVPAETAVDEAEFGDTSLSREEVTDKFERWERGETVESTSTPVARVEVSEAEMATLHNISQPFKEVDPSAVQEGITDKAARRQTHLTIPQSKVVHEVGSRFLAAVQQDAEQNGLGPLDMPQYAIRVGLFEPRYGLIPHADPYRYPAVRYVLSIGEAGATAFIHGPMQKDQLSSGGAVTTEAQKAMTPQTHPVVNHGAGVVSRFLANHDIHATPPTPGFRLFFTVDIDLRRYDEPAA